MKPLLRIGVDARTLNVAHMRGTGRYIYEILRHVQEEDGVHWTVFGHDPSRPVLVPSALRGEVKVFGFRGHRFQAWEQVGLPWHLRKGGLHLMHCADNTAPLWQPLPTVVTIHDTVPWAETAPDRLTHHYLHHLQPLALRRSAAVITISRSSRNDILARWPELESKLHVISHGIAPEFFDASPTPLPAVLQQALRGKPYLLYLGGPQPRKRFNWALELLGTSDRPDLHLVAVGFGAGSDKLQAIPQALAGRVHFAPFVSDAELVALYRHAVATVYPTLYEGFGFPAVESQAAGTPVIFSPVSSLADLVGPLAWAVPAQDEQAWRAALNDVLNMPAYARAAKVLAAQNWAEGFSWRKTTEAHLDLYGTVSGRQCLE